MTCVPLPPPCTPQIGVSLLHARLFSFECIDNKAATLFTSRHPLRIAFGVDTLPALLGRLARSGSAGLCNQIAGVFESPSFYSRIKGASAEAGFPFASNRRARLNVSPVSELRPS